jgi:hypothetical protein
MAIKFLRDHSVASVPPESFTEGQVVEDRSPESELHFVRRGVAAFVGEKGALFDHEGKPIAAAAPTAVLVDVVQQSRRRGRPRRRDHARGRHAAARELGSGRGRHQHGRRRRRGQAGAKACGQEEGSRGLNAGA